MKYSPRIIALAISLLLLSACSSEPADQDAQSADGTGELSVVASTSVYADVARVVGGDAVSVRALVDKTSQDPHSYEATARDKLAISKADVVIANGGGYDPFMDALATDAELGSGAMLHAIDFRQGHEAEPTEPGEDHEHTHSGDNEHVWYDVHTMGALAQGLADEYSDLRPERAAEFDAAATAFETRINTLAQRVDALTAQGDGKEFAMTEPLAYYLLTEAGMADGTPEGVSAAMEAGDDLSPMLLKDLSDGLAAQRYAVLAVNIQTSGPQTDKVAALAADAGVPVLELTETLPEGQDYISWMESNVQQLEVALER